MIVKITQFVLTSLLSLEMTLFNLVSIQPLALTPGATHTYGSYLAERIVGETGGSLSFTYGEYGIELPFSSGSGFHFHYTLYQQSQGEIQITVTPAVSWKLELCDFGVSGGYFSSIPSLTSTTASKTFKIKFYECQEIDFVVTAPAASTFGNDTTFAFSFNELYNDATPTDMLISTNSILNGIDVKLSTMTTTLHNDLLGLTSMVEHTNPLPIEMVPAWMFMLTDLDTVSFDNDVYPRIVNSSGTLISRIVRFYPNDPIEFYFIASTSGYNVTVSNSNVNITWERLSQYSVSGSSVYHVTLKYTGTAVNGVTSTLTVTQTAGGWIIPVYYGNGEGISDNIRSLLGLQDPNTGFLERIYNLLSTYLVGGVEPETNPNLIPYDDALTQFRRFVNHVLTVFGLSEYEASSMNPNEQDLRPSVETDINTGTANLTGYEFWQSMVNMSNVVSYVYGGMKSAIWQFGTIATLGMSVLIVRIFVK